AAGHRDQLGGDGAVEIGATEARGALERAILVQDDAGADQRGPRQEIGKAAGTAAIFGKVHHVRLPQTDRLAGIRRCRRPTSTKSGSRLATQTAAKWPTAQMRRPTSQRRRPRPTAPASVPLRIAI